MNEKRLRIPNEDVQLTADEVAVTQTRTFQRLFDLKQLGLAYLVYPYASHTRGAHSIRCLREATKILVALKKDNDPEAPLVRMAALLHDVGHVPFSHTLEDEHAVLSKHDREDRLNRALDALKKELLVETAKVVSNATPILLAISGGEPSKQDWRSDLVGNTVCADLLAYITTDAEWTGIEKRPGHYRIYEYFTLHDNRLCIRLTKGGIRTDIVSAIMDLLDMRYALTERVYFHHAKCVASAMLARAARLCELSDAHEPQLMKMGDEKFLDFLETLANELMNHDQQAEKDAGVGAKRVLDCLRSRRLYQRVYKVARMKRAEWDASRSPGDFCNKWRDRDHVERVLRAVEGMCGLPVGSLALWCPKENASTKLVEANVVWETASGLQGPRALRNLKDVGAQFDGIGSRVKTIEDQYLDLWNFWIAMDRQYIAKAPEVVQALARNIEIECDLVFRETYLNLLPGFKERSDNFTKVVSALQQLEPSVMDAMSQQAALSGETSFDNSKILAAAEEVIHAKTEAKQPRRRKTEKKQSASETQPSLPLAEPGDEESKSDGGNQK